MNHKHYRILFLLFISLALMLTISTCAKKTIEGEENTVNGKTAIITENDNFYIVPAFYWPKITIGGTVTAVLFFVALIIGILSYPIGLNAGGKENKGQIFFAITTATLVGMLGRAVTIWVKIQFFRMLLALTGENEMLAGTIAELVIYFFWIIFISGISVYLYETFTVTAKEIYQGG